MHSVAVNRPFTRFGGRRKPVTEEEPQTTAGGEGKVPANLATHKKAPAKKSQR